MICFDCSKEYRWVYRDGGLKPVNTAGGSLHWATCRAFRQRGKGKRKKKDRSPATRFTARTNGDICDIARHDGDTEESSAAEQINQEADERLQAALLEE